MWHSFSGVFQTANITIPHFAAIPFADSRFASHAGQLRSDLAPKIRRPRSPIRATETSARYGRGESSRETERVGYDPFRLSRKIFDSELLFDLASGFPHRPSVINCARSVFARVEAEPAAIRWPTEEGVAAVGPVLVAVGRYHGLAAGPHQSTHTHRLPNAATIGGKRALRSFPARL